MLFLFSTDRQICRCIEIQLKLNSTLQEFGVLVKHQKYITDRKTKQIIQESYDSPQSPFLFSDSKSDVENFFLDFSEKVPFLPLLLHLYERPFFCFCFWFLTGKLLYDYGKFNFAIRTMVIQQLILVNGCEVGVQPQF